MNITCMVNRTKPKLNTLVSAVVFSCLYHMALAIIMVFRRVKQQDRRWALVKLDPTPENMNEEHFIAFVIVPLFYYKMY